MSNEVGAVQPSAVFRQNRYCGPLRSMYERLEDSRAASWNDVEQDFLSAMHAFDEGLPRAFTEDAAAAALESKELSAALQNGKGDWFNNVLADLLERGGGLDSLYVRRSVPGLVIQNHNLDGVYPGDPALEIQFLFEAKMMGTPKHANSPNQRLAGRAGSADTGKRVKELAFKSIDLKGEASRRRAIAGANVGPGLVGGDLTTWIHRARPSIYFFIAARVIDDTDLLAMVRWAQTAEQVVDAVGLFCYQDDGSSYRRHPDVPTVYELERVLYRACNELRELRGNEVPAVTDLPTSPAAAAEALSDDADSKP
jgi:hypothetical protein